MKKSLNVFVLLNFLCCMHSLHAQTCYDLGPRNNGNGLGNTCGTPNCSADGKQGHFNVSFGASCPASPPTMQLIAVTDGSLPTPFCFDPGSCISPGTVRYCYRGANLPSSGFMTIRLTQGASIWSCTYSVDGGGGTILPVQLTNFETKLQQGNALVLWRTEQEFNSEKFDIERSSDNNTFIAIGAVSAQGTSSSPVNYEFRDIAPLKGVSYYRLKQIDTDKSFSYSMVKRVDNRINGIQIKQVFPNPATDKVTLQLFINIPLIINAKIINSSGKQVIGEQRKLLTGEQNWELDISRLPAGIYEIMLGNESGVKISERLIVR